MYTLQNYILKETFYVRRWQFGNLALLAIWVHQLVEGSVDFWVFKLTSLKPLYVKWKIDILKTTIYEVSNHPTDSLIAVTIEKKFKTYQCLLSARTFYIMYSRIIKSSVYVNCIWRIICRQNDNLETQSVSRLKYQYNQIYFIIDLYENAESKGNGTFLNGMKMEWHSSCNVAFKIIKDLK